MDPNCSFDFGSGQLVQGLRNLFKHIISDHSSTTAVHFDCCGNPLSTYRLRKLMQHLQEHFTGELLLPCIELACQKEFESLPKLRRHVNNQHPNAAYKVDTQAGSMKKRVHGADHASSKRQRTLRKDRSQGSNLSNQHPQRRKETLDDLSICASKYIGAAKEAVQPFLDLGYESQPVTIIEQTVETFKDGTIPLHFDTGDLLPFDIRKTNTIVMTDMLRNRPAKFASGDLTQPLQGDDQVLTAQLLSQIVCPDPASNELLYAANIKGVSEKSPIRVPGLLNTLRNFKGIDGYSSNVTPQGTVVDLHRGKCQANQTSWTGTNTPKIEWTFSLYARVGRYGYSSRQVATTFRL
jgi:hypothetical protein